MLRIDRITIRHYKSLAEVTLPLHGRGLVFFVGRNGSGKSNVVDALRFVSDALQVNLDYALSRRGGIGEIRQRSRGKPFHVTFRMTLQGEILLEENRREEVTATFAFTLGDSATGPVKEEKAVVRSLEGHRLAFYHVRKGKIVDASRAFSARPQPDDLFLRSLTGEPGFADIFETLGRMRAYHPSPDVMRELQSPDPSPFLHRDGRNLPSILKRMPDPVRKRIGVYLESLIPGLEHVASRRLGPKETLEFKVHSWKFYAHSMSDGTLRAVAILVAAFQESLRLVAVEEPEISLHPAAVHVLTDALLEASEHKPVLVTTHSPEILDHPDIEKEHIYLVLMDEEGITTLHPVRKEITDLVKNHLFTFGELLRQDQLVPEK